MICLGECELAYVERGGCSDGTTICPAWLPVVDRARCRRACRTRSSPYRGPPAAVNCRHDGRGKRFVLELSEGDFRNLALSISQWAAADEQQVAMWYEELGNGETGRRLRP